MKFLAIVILTIGLSAVAATAQDLQGVLKAREIAGVTVNGNAATNGLTILSGAEIKTSATSVNIRIPDLGLVTLGPNSTAKLEFSRGIINLTIVSGSGSVTVEKGMSGSLTDPNGKVTKNKPEVDKYILKYPDDGQQSPLIIGSGGGLPAVAWFAIVGGAISAIAVPVALSVSNTQP